MTQVQTRSAATSASPPAPATRALLDVISRYTNRLEDGDRPGHKIISARLAPTDAERALLNDRRSDLIASLQAAGTPQDRELMLRVIGSLLAAFPIYGAPEDQLKLTIGMIGRALEDVPVWAVQKAAANFLKGRQKVAWNPEKAPTPPQIRSEAMLAVLDVETELHRLSQVLDAELVDNDTTEDERAAALAHWAQIRSGIASTNVLTERTDEEIAAERAAMQRANERVRAREAAGRAKQQVTA
jgi:hypothetical protein